jgi:lambda family phage minor tail protein L
MKTVVSDFIKLKNKLGEAITPIWLYSIQYDSDSNSWLYYNGSGVDVIFDGVLYLKQVVIHDTINEGSSGRLNNTIMKIGNADRGIQYYLENYNGLKKCRILIKIVFKEALDNPDCFDEYEYFVDSSSAQEEFATINLASAFDVLNLLVPSRIFSANRCQYKQFKGVECGYSGGVSSCDRTLQTCQTLLNSSRFGGFVGVPMAFKEAI